MWKNSFNLKNGKGAAKTEDEEPHRIKYLMMPNFQ